MYGGVKSGSKEEIITFQHRLDNKPTTLKSVPRRRRASPCATDLHFSPDLLTPGTVGKPLTRPFDGVFGSVGRLAVPRWRSLASADGWRAVPRGGSRWYGIGQLRAVHHTSVVLSLCRRHSAIAPARSLHHRLGACSTNIGTEGDERPITCCVCTPDSPLSRSACRPNT